MATERLLRERLAGADAREIEYVATLIGALPGSLVEGHLALIALVLQLAGATGTECFERVEASLQDALVPTRWESVVGEPDPNQVEAMAKASRIAESLPVGSPERSLFGNVASSIGRNIAESARRDEESFED